MRRLLQPPFLVMDKWRGLSTARPTDSKFAKSRMMLCLCSAGAHGKAKVGKPLSPEEAKALAAREAARQRVQVRTAQEFGLGL